MENIKIDFKSLSNSKGYKRLKQDVIDTILRDTRDKRKDKICFSVTGCNKKSGNCVCFHRYCNTFKWAIDRAKHYALFFNMKVEEVLDAWEDDRSYWFMNFYQDCNFPKLNLKNSKLLIFDTVEEAKKFLSEHKYICPRCGGISSDPTNCNSGKEMFPGKICDWKAYGLLGTLGRGTAVCVKEDLRTCNIFEPIIEKKEVQP